MDEPLIDEEGGYEPPPVKTQIRTSTGTPLMYRAKTMGARLNK